MRKTHFAVGCAATSLLVATQIVTPIGIVGVLGATAPDIDYRIGLEHRTITHSLLALVVSSALISFLNLDIAIAWFINYLLHLICDSFTKTGVPFLYPFIEKRYGPKLMVTGSSIDYFIAIVSLYIFSEILILI